VSVTQPSANAAQQLADIAQQLPNAAQPPASAGTTQAPPADTSDTPSQEQAVKALVDNEVPVTRASIINLYLANAAVRKVASVAGNSNLALAGAYLYERGVQVDNTPVTTLSSLLETALDSVGRSRVSAMYRDSMRMKNAVERDSRIAYVKSEQKSSASSKKADTRETHGNASPAGGTKKAGADDQAKTNDRLLNAHIEETQMDRKTAFVNANTAAAANARNAGGSAFAADSSHNADNASRVEYVNAPAGRPENALPGAARNADDTGDANNRGQQNGAISASSNIASENNAGLTSTKQTNFSEQAPSSSALASSTEAPSASNQTQPQTGGANNGEQNGQSFIERLIDRILTSVTQIRDIGAGQLALLTGSGAPSTADGLAAARHVADNTFSFSSGLIALEEYLMAKTGGQAPADNAGTRNGALSGSSGDANAGSNGGTGINQGGGLINADGLNSEYFRDAANTRFFSRHDLSGEPSGDKFNASDGGNRQGSGGMRDGANQGGDPDYRQALRELAALRSFLPKADLAALKQGANITDIYSELKTRLWALENRFTRLFGGQDDSVAKIISSMKDNIRAQEQMNRGPVCFQIPFLYNQKPSSLTVYVFDQKKNGRGKKAGDDLSVALNLETQTLGVVDIGMKVSDKKVDFDITVQNRGVRNFLESITGTLGERIRDTGFSVGEITCSVKTEKTGAAIGSTEKSGSRTTRGNRAGGAAADADELAIKQARGILNRKASQSAGAAGLTGVDVKI